MNEKITWLLATVLLTAVSLAEAQQPKRIPQIGYISYGSVEIEKSWLAVLQQGLRELGYLEGKNIVIEQRHAAGRSEKLPELLAELIRLKVDVLVAAGDPAAHGTQLLIIAVSLLIVFSSAPAQDKPKLPISASSKTLGYSPLWVASKLGFFDKQGLDVELVLVNGADKSTMALMGGSVYVSSGGVDTVIAAVEQGADLATIGGVINGLTHYIMAFIDGYLFYRFRKAKWL